MSIEAANAETTRIVIAENVRLMEEKLELEKQVRQLAAQLEMKRYAEEPA
jgi:hypothetical protein